MTIKELKAHIANMADDARVKVAVKNEEDELGIVTINSYDVESIRHGTDFRKKYVFDDYVDTIELIAKPYREDC